MRRALIGVMALVSGSLAMVLPAPEPAATTPDQTVPVPLATATGIWYCSGGELAADPLVSSVLVDRGSATITLLQDGDVVDSATIQSSSGLAQFNVGDVLPFYPGAAIVEVSESPSAVGLLLVGENVVAGAGCEAAAKEIFLVGGGTGPDLALTVRLFNPLLESGVADLTVHTEFGLEPLLDFDRVVVAPRSFVDVPLGRLLGERATISVRVTVAEGVVVSSLASKLPGGGATWNGSGLARRWEFPVTVAGTGTTVAIWNPADEPAAVTISAHGPEGLEETSEVEVGPLRDVRVDLATTGGAIVVDSPLAVAAAVTYEGVRGYAGTTGLAQPADRWLLPVVGAHPGSAQLGMFNGGEVAASVLVRPLGSEQATRVEVAPGTAMSLEAPGPGLEVVTNAPITVGWRIDAGTESALGLGVPIR